MNNQYKQYLNEIQKIKFSASVVYGSHNLKKWGSYKNEVLALLRELKNDNNFENKEILVEDLDQYFKNVSAFYEAEKEERIKKIEEEIKINQEELKKIEELKIKKTEIKIIGKKKLNEVLPKNKKITDFFQHKN